MSYEIEVTILRDDETIGGTCPAAELRLPANRYELADALERARVSEEHPGYIVTECQCPIPGLADLLPESAPLPALNLLAHRLAGLSEYGRMAYEALLKTDAHPKTPGNLVNLTFNLNACQCVNAKDDAALGKHLVDNDLVPELESVPERVLGWLDYGKIGAAQREAEQGVFVSGGYVANDAVGWKPAYPEELTVADVPDLDAPMDGIFRVYPGVDGMPEGFTLPVDAARERDLLERLNADSFDDVALIGAHSSISPLDALLEPYESFDYLNEIAAVLAELPEAERLKLKAVLDYEGCGDFSEAAALSRELDAYEYFPELDTPEDYGRWLLLGSAKLSPCDPGLDLLAFEIYGQAMMERDGARCTRYGIVRRLNKG